MRFVLLFIFLSFITCSNQKQQIQSQEKLTFIFDFDSTLHNSPVGYPSLLRTSIFGKEKADKMLPDIKNFVKKCRKENMSDVIIVQKIMLKYDVKPKQKDIDFINFEVAKYETVGLGDVIKKLKSEGHQVLIIGGGIYGCAIIPEFVKQFEIEKDDIYSGYFKDFSKKSLKRALGCDNFEYVNCSNPDTHTIYSEKKSELIKLLKNQNKIKGKVVHIGDGENDLEVWEANQADIFIGFGVNRVIEKVKEKSPIFVKTIRDFNKVIEKIIK